MKKYIGYILLMLLSISSSALADDRSVNQLVAEPADMHAITLDSEGILQHQASYRSLIGQQTDTNHDSLIDDGIDDPAAHSGRIEEASIYGESLTGSEWIDAINTDDVLKGDIKMPGYHLPLTSDQKRTLHSTSKLVPISMKELNVSGIMNVWLKNDNKTKEQEKVLDATKFKITKQTDSLEGAINVSTEDLTKQSKQILKNIRIKTEAIALIALSLICA